MTGGIADAGGLFDCLVGIHEGKADHSILDKYSEIRSQKWRDVINVTSTENLKLLSSVPSEKAAETELIQRLRWAAANPELAARTADEVRCLPSALRCFSWNGHLIMFEFRFRWQ